ncbi:MAG: hypothetical protein GY803_23005 [Chloroflexi bacterium]|nr:hypothetical protein [Chloroflexota bacterium]
MNNWRRFLLPVVLTAAGLALLGLYALQRERPSPPISSPPPTLTPQPIVPTKTATPLMSPSPTSAAVTSPTPTPTPFPTPTSAAVGLYPMRERFGVGAPGGGMNIPPALAAGLPAHLYLDWNINIEPPGNPDIAYWQMVRLRPEGVVQSWEEIAAVAEAQPGAVWIVGNEPDVVWQDNLTAERYAELYHAVYQFIKERDPSAQIAVAGVAQPTPLRLAYLDRILAAYEDLAGEPMPVDIWTIHAFILREETGSWGVDIPPGMDGANGRLYEIADHNNIAIFRQFVFDFRAWMAERGYADRPLAVTEMGILMPFDYGFPPEVVVDFIAQAFDFLATAVDDTGYAADGGRLVQRWFWYSLNDREDSYPTGNLYDPDTGQLTALGQAYADYVNGRYPQE